MSARLPLHAMILIAVLGVVAGGGYWDRLPIRSTSAPTDANRALRLGQLPTSIEVASLGWSGTGSPDGAMAGYVSQFASAVTPGQLKVQVVVARGGQSIADLAAETGRRTETLLWANGMTDPAKPLAAGTAVRVPPVDGMLHLVHDGDTLESIAARYQVEVAAITGYAPNTVERSADLVPARLLMVPGGKMPTRQRVVTYTVREGDTLATIASYFGLRASTILWANSLPNGNLIFPGQSLAILPVDGVMVPVREGDTVESLAEKYGVEPGAIRDYAMNGLGGAGQLRVDQLVMIPGGEPPAPPPPVPAPAPVPAVAAQAAEAPAQSAPAPAPARATGRFVWPTNGVITQYYGPTDFWMEPAYLGYAHFHQGLDLASGLYTPIVAPDAGTVVFSGWNSAGYGFAVSIDHGNGLVTWFAHMAEQPPVRVGQRVAQGQYIGPMGSTGASTGSHLHFGVLRNGVWDDPLKYLP